MTCETVLVSNKNNFDNVILVTEIFVPQEELWIGDYPYLNRKQFIRYADKIAKDTRFQYSQSKNEFSKSYYQEMESDEYRVYSWDDEEEVRYFKRQINEYIFVKNIFNSFIYLFLFVIEICIS